jgi:alginate O-acetyltransferase complex protein AlgI
MDLRYGAAILHRVGIIGKGGMPVLFSSIIFICYFFPVFIAFYIATGARTSVLLTGSVLFYTWGEGQYIFLLFGLITANFGLAHVVARQHGRARAIFLVLALTLDLAVLALFKYDNFFADTVNTLVRHKVVPHADLQLPLGISFFTFQLVSYLIDVYRDQVNAERSLPRFATYILMFPHLIAGPIVRYADIRAELVLRKQSSARFGLGLQYFVVGLCQKVLVANTLGPIADYVFSMPTSMLGGVVAWPGIFAYTLQIYFDFCGYSNMAIGLAFMLGFTFPKNFDYPYASRSITDFWRRWHMSLSFWFRDYVYISLGGNRGSQVATMRNLLIVFFLTGLWHGAAWNFVFWGLFHGSFLLIERLWLGKKLMRLPHAFGWAYTLLVVMIGWVFFRADSFRHAVHFLARMFSISHFGDTSLDFGLLITPEVLAAFAFGVVLSFPVLPDLLDRAGKERIARSAHIKEERLDTVYVHALPILLLLIGFILSCALLASTTLNPFLYFRF